MSAEQPAPNNAQVVIRRGPLVAPVLSRVVGMLAARAQCPIDRLDDALLLADAISAHAPSFTVNGRVGVTVAAAGDGLRLRVGPLRPEGASGLLRSAELPGVGNVLERVADEVSVDDGSGDEEHLLVRLGFGR
jgi:serine/threonine-protein kinase RsbW